jgi:hypothetical protein
MLLSMLGMYVGRRTDNVLVVMHMYPFTEPKNRVVL